MGKFCRVAWIDPKQLIPRLVYEVITDVTSM